MFHNFRSRITKGLHREKLPRPKGWIQIQHIRNGQVIAEQTIKNIVCNAGLGQISGYINGVITGKSFTYGAIGTGTLAVAATDTVLQSEITTGGGARATGTASQVTTSVTNDTAQWVFTWNFTASFAVSESGIFDASSAGNLLCHQAGFGPFNVVSGDQIQLTWKVAA